jgi:hypothetical protein
MRTPDIHPLAAPIQDADGRVWTHYSAAVDGSPHGVLHRYLELFDTPVESRPAKPGEVIS